MIHISILALKNAVLASIADARHVFVLTNQWLRQAGKPPLFEVQVVGLWDSVRLNEGIFTIHPDITTSELQHTDLIIIPSMSGDMITSTYLNKDYISWIGERYQQGAEVASLCSGVFLLAFSGLLHHRQCTTHWDYINEFRSFYPSAQLLEGRIFTEHNGLYTSGGNNAYWNLLLHLVEKFTDRRTAIYVAKYFVIDIDRLNQSPFAIFKGSQQHDDALIKSIQAYIEKYFREKLTVSDIATRFNMTRRTLERRFAKATYLTVSEYIQRVKIEVAKKLLETGRRSVTQVMQDVGYSDTQTFREVFKKVTEMTPVAYRSKYNKNLR